MFPLARGTEEGPSCRPDSRARSVRPHRAASHARLKSHARRVGRVRPGPLSRVSARIVERDAETRRIYESTLDGLTGPFWSFVYGKEVFLTWARSPEEVFPYDGGALSPHVLNPRPGTKAGQSSPEKAPSTGPFPRAERALPT